MMRALGIVLISLFCLNGVKSYLPYLEYAVNKDHISQFFCINKENTEIQCNGKCYLSAQLSKANEKENDPINSQKSSRELEIELFFIEDQHLKESFEFSEGKELFTIRPFDLAILTPSPEVPTPPPKFMLIKQTS